MLDLQAKNYIYAAINGGFLGFLTLERSRYIFPQLKSVGSELFYDLKKQTQKIIVSQLFDSLTKGHTPPNPGLAH